MTSTKPVEYGKIETMLATLEALVRAESPSDDVAACRDVVLLAADIATRVLGRPAQIKEIEGRPVFWWGAEKPEIVLLAHLDTVWPKGSFAPLWNVEGDVVQGPGAFDMKAGFVQALYALRGIEGSVALIGTTDEEIGSQASRELIKAVAKDSKAVLVLESAIDGKLKTGRKGTSMYQIIVHGRAAHAGLEPEKGINATVEIAHIITALALLENKEHGTTVVATTLHSGTTTNTVPDKAILDVDARSFSRSEQERVDKAIKSIKGLHPEVKIEVIGGINRPPMEPSSAAELYQRAEKVAAHMGIGPFGSAQVGGASDGNFAAATGAKVLDGLGAVGGGAHANNEWVSVAALEERSRFLHEFIKDLLND